MSTLRALEPSRRVADHSAGNRFLLLAEYSDREPVIRADVEVFNVHLLSIRALTGTAPRKGTSGACGQAIMTAPIWGVDGSRMPHTPRTNLRDQPISDRPVSLPRISFWCLTSPRLAARHR